MQRYETDSDFKENLRETRQDFQNARLSRIDSHNYLIDDLRREKFDGAIRATGLAGALCVPLLGAGLFILNAATDYLTGNATPDFFDTIVATAATAIATLPFVHLALKGYGTFSHFRPDYLKKVKFEGLGNKVNDVHNEINRALKQTDNHSPHPDLTV